MRKIQVYIILLCSVFSSCVSEKEEGLIISDAVLFDMLKSSSSFNFYKNNPDTLPSDVSSPHGAYMRVLFNPKASAAMNDSMTELKVAAFPNESYVIKEVYDESGGPLQYYVVMYKMTGAANSGSGWVWNQCNPDGTVIFSAAEKGDQCIGCHTSLKNTDLVTTFFLH